MRSHWMMLLSLLGWLGCAWAAEAGGPGTTGANVLKAGLGARATALGGAYGAVGQDSQVLLFNPAGLATIKGTDVVFQHYFALEEVSYELFGYAQQLEASGVLGSTLVWRHLPSIDNPGAPDDPVLANDAVWTLGFSKPLSALLENLPPLLAGLNFGLAGKILYSSLRETHAWGAALDVGLFWSSQTTLPVPVNVSAAVQNVGTPMKFLEVADPLPWQGRLGVSLVPFATNRHRGLAAVEWILSPDQSPKTSIGVEYVYADLLSLRCGYDFAYQENLSGPAAGLGLKFAVGGAQTRLDYAFHPQFWSAVENMANNHVISLGASF